MKKYIMYINIDDIKFSVKVLKERSTMDGGFNSVVKNERDVFRYNSNYWMSYNRKKLKEAGIDYLTKRIEALLDTTQELISLRDKI